MTGDTEPEDMVVVGRVGAPNGVLGWVNVTSYTQPRQNILDYGPWHLQRDDAWERIEMAQRRLRREKLTCRFEGVDDRDAADRLKGRLIAVPASALPELDEDEYYWRDLEGLPVRTTQGATLGTVERMMETGAHDVMVVRDGERERLVPFVRQIVLRVALADAGARGEILVDWDPDF